MLLPRRERCLSDRNRCEVPPRSCFGGADARRCDAADLDEEYNALALRKLRGEQLTDSERGRLAELVGRWREVFDAPVGLPREVLDANAEGRQLLRTLPR